jgi:hypothetical protein
MRLGFVGGRTGLQGLWCRYLVGAKVAEVRHYLCAHRVDVHVAIEQVLGIGV